MLAHQSAAEAQNCTYAHLVLNPDAISIGDIYAAIVSCSKDLQAGSASRRAMPEPHQTCTCPWTHAVLSRVQAAGRVHLGGQTLQHAGSIPGSHSHVPGSRICMAILMNTILLLTLLGCFSLGALVIALKVTRACMAEQRTNQLACTPWHRMRCSVWRYGMAVWRLKTELSFYHASLRQTQLQGTIPKFCRAWGHHRMPGGPVSYDMSHTSTTLSRRDRPTGH